jgi:hypothetical protein
MDGVLPEALAHTVHEIALDKRSQENLLLFPLAQAGPCWSKFQCSEAFDLSLRRVNQLFADGVLQGEDSIQLCKQYLSFLEKSDPRKRYQAASAEKVEIQIKQLKGSVISVGKVRDDLTFLLGGLKARLLGWSRSLPGILANLDERECSKILLQEANFVLKELSEGVERIFSRERHRKKNRKS